MVDGWFSSEQLALRVRVASRETEDERADGGKSVVSRLGPI